MKVDELERELRAERQEIDPAFADRLDEWAAHGFPRGGELDPRRERRRDRPFAFLDRLGERDRSRPARRRPMLAPGGAAAAAAMLFIVVGVFAVTQIEPSGDDRVGSLGGGDVPALLEGETTVEEGPGGERSEGSARREIAPALGEHSRLDNGAANLGSGEARRSQRRVAQTISVALATSAEDFRDSADGVLDVVATHNGFVTNSSVSGGDPDVDGAELGQARFQLRIPAAQLPAALAALSDLGHLVSRTDGTRDITARFESARDRIEAFTEARARLLTQLEEAVTEAEQESIRRRLRIVDQRLESARDDLARAQQRVRLVPVAVTITADESIDGGAWGIGEAFDDARDILRTALAVALVSAAVLLPIALLALIGFLLSRAFARHRRERVLDQPET